MKRQTLDSDSRSNSTIIIPYTPLQAALIGISAGLLSFVTITGNLMVMISFKMDKQLQTISNYFLFSLAVADIIIGTISMPLFTGKHCYYYYYPFANAEDAVLDCYSMPHWFGGRCLWGNSWRKVCVLFGTHFLQSKHAHLLNFLVSKKLNKTSEKYQNILLQFNALFRYQMNLFHSRTRP